MRLLHFISIGIIGLLLFSACSSSVGEVEIGNQVWMSQNLDVTHFNNGDVIPEVITQEEWFMAGINQSPAWCYYNFASKNGDEFGKLYNWYAVNDSRGLAPEGWRIPGESDWNKLIDYLGGVNVAGGKLKEVDGKHWIEPNQDATDEYGFSAVAGGYCDNDGFFDAGVKGLYWTKSSTYRNSAHYRWLTYESGKIFKSATDRNDGLSVRCVKTDK